MPKRVFLIHGWEGYPENNWFPWLKRELESRDFSVFAPAMPDTDEPRIEPWVSKLSEVVGTPDTDTYFVGHSIGCQTIMRYLQSLPKGSKVGGVIFVAGFVTLTPTATRDPEDKAIIKPWFETPLYFDKMKAVTGNYVAIFSDNDENVPLKENSKAYQEKLGAKIIVEHGKGHFSDDAGITELPVVLEELLRISG